MMIQRDDFVMEIFNEITNRIYVMEHLVTLDHKRICIHLEFDLVSFQGKPAILFHFFNSPDNGFDP
jgi:hypothetical protein